MSDSDDELFELFHGFPKMTKNEKHTNKEDQTTINVIGKKLKFLFHVQVKQYNVE